MPKQEIIFYDGECGFCHRWIRFILAHDKRDTPFFFAPRQSAYYEKNVPLELASEESIFVLSSTRDFLNRSDAVSYILKALGGPWRYIGIFISLIPKFIRDTGYRFVSKIRKGLGKKPDGVCPVVPEEYRARFLTEL